MLADVVGGGLVSEVFWLPFSGEYLIEVKKGNFLKSNQSNAFREHRTTSDDSAKTECLFTLPN